MMSEQRKSARGFASMETDKQREIASKGGKAAHEKGTAHEFTPDEARQAGRKGGMMVSRDRAHMAAIGREGGFASRMRREALKRAALSGTEIVSGTPVAHVGAGSPPPAATPDVSADRKIAG